MTWYWWVLIAVAVIAFETFKAWYLSQWLKKQFEIQTQIEQILEEESRDEAQ